MPEPLLQLRDINTHYGAIHILKDVNIEVHEGEIVCLLGGNASGKSTTLKTILGLVRPTSGDVIFRSERVNGRSTSYRVEHGMAVVPENRRIFGTMSVLENLLMGAYLRQDEAGVQEDLERVLALFPRLRERLQQAGGTLSGGEQQMLAFGRALMSRPKLILMDEPSMGLAPLLVEQNFQTIQAINRQGVTIFMVEQNANMALSIAPRGYVLQTGRVVLTDRATSLLDNEHLRRAYLGR
ncbi:MAG: ABC transporter ATP-binding protein [Chloroflexota bacterium]|nr:ABC transporter ATP-binding protein [Chloroflexota bacterium]